LARGYRKGKSGRAAERRAPAQCPHHRAGSIRQGRDQLRAGSDGAARQPRIVWIMKIALWPPMAAAVLRHFSSRHPDATLHTTGVKAKTMMPNEPAEHPRFGSKHARPLTARRGAARKAGQLVTWRRTCALETVDPRDKKAARGCDPSALLASSQRRQNDDLDPRCSIYA